MSLSQRFVVLDYETYSEADLKKVGAYEYSLHSTTEILCASFRVGTRETLRDAITETWCPLFPNHQEVAYRIQRYLLDDSITFCAHNAFFEQCITAKVFLPQMLCNRTFNFQSEPRRWICTASLAAALALPRSLEGAANAIELATKKDMVGNKLIQKWCKPRKYANTHMSIRHQDEAELRRIVEYCEQDIAVETELFLRLPPLNETERKVWCLDQKINFRGFRVDIPLIEKVLEMTKTEVQNLNAECSELTMGVLRSATQRSGVIEWLASVGTHLDDLRAKTIEDKLKDYGTVCYSQLGKRMLEIRQAVSKTSTAKYQAFHLRSASDDRCRDNLLYWAASTGRWGGRGVQPQNFPRGKIKRTLEASEELETGDLEWIRLLYGDPMEVFSSCLRNMIIPSEGKELFVADYAAIEARVLFWIARHEHGIKAFTENRDLYKEMAAHIFNVDHLENVTPHQRQVGKGVVLGCGYQMGAKKFLLTCEAQGIIIDEMTAERAVKTYRSTHSPVVILWNNIQRAAIAAIQTPGKTFTVNRTKWWRDKTFLWCELPSKRRLAYYDPKVSYEPTPFGEKRPVIWHYGVNSLTKKWVNDKTYGGRLTENVVQAVARDFMAEAMLRLEDQGYEIILTVHDEILAERKIGEGQVSEFENFMAELPPWGEGCPIKASGWKGTRYKK